MEDDDPHALLDTDAAIQPYLDVLKDVSDAGTVRTMILKALSDPQVFCGFDQIQAACGSTHLDAKATATLELFSFGTYGDYAADTSKFLPLNDTHVFKLRQLTILTCVQQALTTASSISYSVLEQAVQCPLEPILIPCLYSRILNGKLCQKTKRFLWTVVPPCISRDVPLANLDAMLSSLTGLQQRLRDSQGELQSAHSFVSEKLEQSNAYWQSVKERTKKAQQGVKSNRNTSWLGDSGQQQQGPPQAVGAASRRSSASRQSKRSRGGLSGSFSEPFQRY